MKMHRNDCEQTTPIRLYRCRDTGAGDMELSASGTGLQFSLSINRM